MLFPPSSTKVAKSGLDRVSAAFAVGAQHGPRAVPGPSLLANGAQAEIPARPGAP